MKRKQPDSPQSPSEPDSGSEYDVIKSSRSDEEREETTSGDSDGEASASIAESGADLEDTDSSDDGVQATSEAALPRQHQNGSRAAHNAPSEQPAAPTRSAPTLPWMRVPIAIEGGASVPLADVKGLQPELASALQKGSCIILRKTRCCCW